MSAEKANMKKETPYRKMRPNRIVKGSLVQWLTKKWVHEGQTELKFNSVSLSYMHFWLTQRISCAPHLCLPVNTSIPDLGLTSF